MCFGTAEMQDVLPTPVVICLFLSEKGVMFVPWDDLLLTAVTLCRTAQVCPRLCLLKVRHRNFLTVVGEKIPEPWDSCVL